MTHRTLMAIGAHADDIELNVGGTLSKYCEADYKVVYIMSTNNFSGGWKRRQPDGSILQTTPPYHEEMPQRKLEAAAAAKHFGAKPIHLDHPQRHYTRDNGTTAEVRYGCELPKGLPEDSPTILTAYEHKPSVQRLSDLILEHKPEAILTHGIAAGNIEHFATCLLAANAYWKARKAGHAGMFMQWPELGITTHGKLNYRWDSFVDISRHLDQKLAAIAEHACQISDVSRLDFEEWGVGCGCQHAEVFSIVAGIERPDPHQAFTLEILKNRR